MKNFLKRLKHFSFLRWLCRRVEQDVSLYGGAFVPTGKVEGMRCYDPRLASEFPDLPTKFRQRGDATAPGRWGVAHLFKEMPYGEVSDE